MSSGTLNAAEILHHLVAIPSVSALSNVPLLEHITALLEPAGWHTQRLSYTSADGATKANLLAVPRQFASTLPRTDLLFVCHTDTVPFRKEWTAATQLTQRDRMLHGCGACDVKGSLAGLLAAALAIRVQDILKPVAFAFTAEEEIGCLGANHLIASKAIQPRKVVVCEPTSLQPAVAGKGYGLAEIVVHGHEAHSAFSAQGVSAIYVAAEMIRAIQELARTWDGPTNPLFTPPHTSLNVGVLQGGTAKNIIPGDCTFLVEWRPLPTEEPRRCGEFLQQLADDVAARNPGSAIDVHLTRADAGFAASADSPLGSALESLFGRARTGISFGSEATRLLAIAEEVCVIGPGNMQTAHSDRECVPIDELEEWTAGVGSLFLHGVP